jgi:hypothetical protein
MLPSGMAARDIVAGKADLQAMMPVEPRVADFTEPTGRG